MSHGRRAIPLAECKNMVFMGTLACGGHAMAVVVATGKKSGMRRLLVHWGAFVAPGGCFMPRSEVLRNVVNVLEDE